MERRESFILQKYERFHNPLILPNIVAMEAVNGLYLWDDDDFQFFRQELVCIFLPIGIPIQPIEITMLDRLLNALDIKHSSRRYLYYAEEKPEIPEASTLVLIFSTDEKSEPVINARTDSGQKVISLPAINAISENQELKRRIWKMLKD